MANKRQNLAFFFIVAIGLVLSSMTQFRVPGLPVGISEAVLILCMLLHLPLGNGIHGGNQPSKFVPVMFLLLLATLPGYFATLTAEGTVFLALYNLIASTYVVVLIGYLHFGYSYKTLSIDQLAKMFLFFSVLYFLMLLLLVAVEPTLVYIQDEIESLTFGAGGARGESDEPIYRLYGFSSNPNQLALHAVLCTFLSLRLWGQQSLFASLICLAASVAIGILTRSDAYLISAVILIGVSVVMGIVYGKSVIFGLIIIVPLLAASVILVKPAYQFATDLAGSGGQDETRFTLWKHGIEAGSERPLIGLGPGAWSGFVAPREMEESHNSAIDYFTNAGLLGLAVFVMGLLGLIFRTFLAGQSTLLGGLAAIIVFATFHNILRQPIMWFGLYFIAHSVAHSAITKRRRRRARSQRSTGLEI